MPSKQQWLNYHKESRSERENWKVKELYTQIKQWLMPLEEDGLLRYKEETLPVSLVGEGIEAEMRDTIEFFNGQTINDFNLLQELVADSGVQTLVWQSSKL